MHPIKRGLIVGLMTVVSAASVAMAAGEPVWHGLRVEPPKAINVHALLNQAGQSTPFPARAAGQWQLAFFGYTHCPDVCPMTLQKTAMLFKHLGADGARLQPVFISIDGSRDSPESLKAFTGQFDKRIVGLTGDAETLRAMANEFGVLTRRFQGKTALAYTLEHSSFIYVLDPLGQVRLMYPATADIPAIADDLRRLWREAGVAMNE